MTTTLTLEEVKAAIVFDQPKLSAEVSGADVRVHGKFLVFEDGVVCNPSGPITEFQVEMYVPNSFPKKEPKVFEVAGDIARHEDNHINPDGDCCITVWEHWLANACDTSFLAFLNGPVNEFFLAQYWHSKTGEWAFGERAHGVSGLLDAYNEALGIQGNVRDIVYYLKLLSLDWPKGHWLCPCGSGRRLRDCHHDRMFQLHKKIPPKLAKDMLRRVLDQCRIKN